LAKSVSTKFVFEEDDKLPKNKRSGTHGIPTDVATGAYIQHVLKQKDVEVDFITPKEISKERLKANDLNFLLIYDILEAFHTDKSVDRTTYNTLKTCLLGAKNVYPPRKYQEFVYSKINYYNYLKENKVNVLPTFTMTTEEYNKLGHDVAMERVLEFWNQEGIRSVIAKPVYGQEGKDVEFFAPTDKGPTGALSAYFRKCMKKYPGLVVQKMVQGFGNTAASPELRMYYLGNKYRYSVCATRNSITHPKAEGGSLDAPLRKLKDVTKKILKKLPPMVMPNGARLPRLITRLDMGYRVDGKYQPFVNEVEFVPSLYAEYKPVKGEIDAYIGHCAKQMVHITRKYVKSQQVSGKGFGASRCKSVKRVASRRVVKHVLKRRLRAAGA